MNQIFLPIFHLYLLEMNNINTQQGSSTKRERYYAVYIELYYCGNTDYSSAIYKWIWILRLDFNDLENYSLIINIFFFWFIGDLSCFSKFFTLVDRFVPRLRRMACGLPLYCILVLALYACLDGSILFECFIHEHVRDLTCYTTSSNCNWSLIVQLGVWSRNVTSMLLIRAFFISALLFRSSFSYTQFRFGAIFHYFVYKQRWNLV